MRHLLQAVLSTVSTPSPSINPALDGTTMTILYVSAALTSAGIAIIIFLLIYYRRRRQQLLESRVLLQRQQHELNVIVQQWNAINGDNVWIRSNIILPHDDTLKLVDKDSMNELSVSRSIQHESVWIDGSRRQSMDDTYIA